MTTAMTARRRTKTRNDADRPVLLLDSELITRASRQYLFNLALLISTALRLQVGVRGDRQGGPALPLALVHVTNATQTRKQQTRNIIGT